LFQRKASEAGQTDEQIRSRYGIEPWEILNNILEVAHLPFRVIEPPKSIPYSLVEQEVYTFAIQDVERNCVVPLEKLSSGEQVIMSTALWRFSEEQVGRHYKLLLLDEPDAHLHPSMTRQFLDVIQQIVVQEWGVRVIMTTHSPSTVALVPLSSLYEMTRNSNPRIRKSTSRAAAISELTDGFVVAHEGMQIVFCEGKNDISFYTAVWERLTVSARGDAALPKQPAMVFMDGKGKEIVKEIVQKLRQKELFHYHGIIDKDDDNQPEDGIHVIQRRALENYLFDPINVWALLHQQGKAPPIPGVAISRGTAYEVGERSEVELQNIADAILNCVQEKLPVSEQGENQRVVIKFLNGHSLQYPKWLLKCHKQALVEAYGAAFPRSTKGQGSNHAELTTNFVTLNFIPLDLLELMQKICGAKQDL
jgi:energy-coupling factor transporter ATP-binding protein EcfA2